MMLIERRLKENFRWIFIIIFLRLISQSKTTRKFWQNQFKWNFSNMYCSVQIYQWLKLNYHIELMFTFKIHLNKIVSWKHFSRWIDWSFVSSYLRAHRLRHCQLGTLARRCRYCNLKTRLEDTFIGMKTERELYFDLFILSLLLFSFRSIWTKRYIVHGFSCPQNSLILRDTISN